MLESSFKTLIVSFIIVVFLLACLNVTNYFISYSFSQARHSMFINELRNSSYKASSDGFYFISNDCVSDCLVVSIPKLVDGYAGRVGFNG